jgi:nicotinamidase/pyrazinamidase
MNARALLLIDLQNDFLPGGALGVEGGDEIIAPINRLVPHYDVVLASQDWHPENHGSFANQHPGKNLYEIVDLDGLPQTLWPDHCVQDTGGALFAPGLNTRSITRVFKKGSDPRIDSYSAFYDNGHRRGTGLAEWLRERGIKSLHVCGLATDYCVKFTVLDALREGFAVNVLISMCRGVGIDPDDIPRAISEMRSAGAAIVE